LRETECASRGTMTGWLIYLLTPNPCPLAP